MSHQVLHGVGYNDHLLALSSSRFPAKRAVDHLKAELSWLLRSGKLLPGEPFPTDDELAELTSLSKSTVRRAVSTLAADGWIERGAGRGSFVAEPLADRDAGVDLAEVSPTGARPGFSDGSASRSHRPWRVGVLSSNDLMDDFCGNWSASRVLHSLSTSSFSRQSFVFEMLRPADAGAASAIHAINDHAPDAILALSACPLGTAGLMHAQALGLPTLGIGSAYVETDAHVVAEDNNQGMALAVERLAESGHSRIGLIVEREPTPVVFERLVGFEDALEARGMLKAGANVLWLEPRPRRFSDPSSRTMMPPHVRRRVITFLRERRLTAVVTANVGALFAMAEIAREGGCRVPDDISLVTIDPVPSASVWLDGVQPDIVEVPLSDIGRRSANLLERLRSSPIEARVLERVPCTLTAGESVSPVLSVPTDSVMSASDRHDHHIERIPR